MSGAQHTPGPWAADHHGHIMAHGGTTNVASTWTTPDANYPEGRPYSANARLIAAAPEMLEALHRASEALEAFKSLARLAEQKQQLAEDEAVVDAAIAKATGKELAA